MDLIFEHAQIAGLIFFFSVFVLIAISVMRPSVKKQLESLAKIPLRED